MKDAKINYSEGDIITVPLSDNSGQEAIGVVARMNGEGIAFGYFFSPATDTTELDSKSSILAGMFGDLGLIDGKWKVVGKVEPWVRDQWPLVPLLAYRNAGQSTELIHYDEETLKEVKAVKVEPESVNENDYHRDGLMGAGFVEKRLTKIINPES